MGLFYFSFGFSHLSKQAAGTWSRGCCIASGRSPCSGSRPLSWRCPPRGVRPGTSRAKVAAPARCPAGAVLSLLRGVALAPAGGGPTACTTRRPGAARGGGGAASAATDAEPCRAPCVQMPPRTSRGSRRRSTCASSRTLRTSTRTRYKPVAARVARSNGQEGRVQHHTAGRRG